MHDVNDEAILARGREILRVEGKAVLRAAGGTLAGIFTDSDRARLFERRLDAALDGPIGQVMTRRPASVPVGMRLRDAVAILEVRRVSELPVVDGVSRPVGLLDIIDLVGLVSPEALATSLGAAA